jgi:hypothetical protein
MTRMRVVRTRDDDGRDRMNEGTMAWMRTRGKGQRSRRATTVPWAHALNLPSLTSVVRGGGTLVLFYFLCFDFYFLPHSLYNIHILQGFQKFLSHMFYVNEKFRK